MNRKLIRKLVLEEVRRKIIAEEKRVLSEVGFLAGAGLALGAAGVAAAALGAGAVYLNYFKKMPVEKQIESILTDAPGKATASPPGNVYIANKAAADALLNSGDLDIPAASDVTVAQGKLSNAFEGTLEKITGFDINTEEGEVTDIINKSKSQLGFAKICASYKLRGRSMLVVLKDEMSNYDFIEYVENPLMALPFALLSDGTPITAAQFAALKPNVAHPPLGYNCGARPAVAHVIKTMVSYGSTRSISITPSAKWTPAVQSDWVTFASHALLNCSIFKDPATSKPKYPPGVIGGVAAWPDVSKALIGEFPGYTPNSAGCLAFAIDAYYDKITCGNKAGSGGSGGSGGTGAPPPKLDKEVDGQEKGTSYSEIIVQVASGAGTVPLSTVFGKRVADDFITELEDNIKESVRKSATQASTMEVDLIFNKSISKVRRVSRSRPMMGRSRINFKGNISGTIKQFFNSKRVSQGKSDKSSYLDDNGRMRILIDVPPNYSPRNRRRS